jgi:hypothetical protein
VLKPDDACILQDFVARYEDLRMPLPGYLLQGRKLRTLNAELGRTLQVENFRSGLRRRSAIHAGISSISPEIL